MLDAAQTKTIYLCCRFLIILLYSYILLQPGIASADEYSILIDRKAHLLTAKDNHNKIIIQTKIGLGRGASDQKKSMADCITPGGRFKVDIILSKIEQLNAVSQSVIEKYKNDNAASAYLRSAKGLLNLFGNMNSIDFDGDKKSDTAYGAAYIGLDSKEAICGPKISQYNGTTYWFSIALHGTNNEAKNIGNSNSGGCIQVPAAALKELLEKHIIHLGSTIQII